MAQDEVTTDLRRLLRIVEEIRKSHPRMELSQLATLLLVLLNPGIRAQDLMPMVVSRRPPSPTT